MAWFQVDDQLSFHPKVIQAGNAAMGMWVRAGAWSQAHLTEGHIPAEQAKALGGLATAKKLVTAGLWETDSERGGFQFHQWDSRQMSADEIKERRAKRSESGKKGGAASAATRRAKAEARRRAEEEAKREALASPNAPKDQASASQNVEQVVKQNRTPAPVPTQLASNEASSRSPSEVNSPPVRVDEIESERASSMIRIPDDWRPSDVHRAKIHHHLPPGVDLDHEADQFRNHAISTGRRCDGRPGWDAAFHTWLGRAKPRPAQGRSTTDDRVAQAQALKHHTPALNGRELE